jgi:cytochrome b561
MASLRASYTLAQRALHWLHAGLILAALPLGVAIGKGENHFAPATMDRLYDLHRSFGFLVLALAVFRVAARAAQGAPAPVATLTRFERIASRATHDLLYALIFLVPLLGWAGTSAYGATISVFGLFTLPALLAQDEPLSKTLLGLHGAAAMAMAALVAAHIGAALMHKIVKKDAVLGRMLPGA